MSISSDRTLAIAQAPIGAAPLDLARIRRRIREVRRTLAQARDELVALYDELQPTKGWTKLGYASWEDLCAAELPELKQMMTVGEKKALVIELRRDHHWSLRAAAAPAGVSPPTAKTWIDDAGIKVDKVRSRDGSMRPASSSVAKPDTPRLTNVARAILIVRGAEAAGVTVHELAKRLRLNQCAASALLSRLAADGRLVYRRPAKRGQTGTYVTPSEENR
jgi:hypothetical protein